MKAFTQSVQLAAGLEFNTSVERVVAGAHFPAEPREITFVQYLFCSNISQRTPTNWPVPARVLPSA
jgi:hypothetical protein